MKLMRAGVYLAKNVFRIHCANFREQPTERHRLPYEYWLQTVMKD